MIPKRLVSSSGTGITPSIEISAFFQVILDHRTIVHFVDVIAEKDRRQIGSGFAQKIEVLVDGIGGASIPSLIITPLIWLQQANTTMAAGFSQLVVCRWQYGR